MPAVTFNFIQLNLICCSRRNRDRGNTIAFDTETASDTFSDFELVHSAIPRPYSRARLRWVRAIFAAILRRKLARAFVELGKVVKRNKAIGRPDQHTNKLWSDTGRWLQQHKL